MSLVLMQQDKQNEFVLRKGERNKPDGEFILVFKS